MKYEFRDPINQKLAQTYLRMLKEEHKLTGEEAAAAVGAAPVGAIRQGVEVLGGASRHAAPQHGAVIPAGARS